MIRGIRRTLSDPMTLLAAIALVATAALAARSSAQDAGKPVDLSVYYGFGPLEIVKLEERSANMLAGDFNSDGRSDLLLVDNSHSRLDLLVQRKDRSEKDEIPTDKQVNAVGSTWRFEHRKLPLDKQVAAAAVGDFNGDGRLDVACFGTPDRLIVKYQPEKGDWTESTTIRLPDVNPSSWIAAGGDLNGDGKDDIAVLGKNETFLLNQQKDGKLAPPKSLMNTANKLALAQIADLDGDGRKDLGYVAEDDQTRSLCARLQGPDGSLGPELAFDLQRPRAITVANLDGKGGHEVLTIDPQTNRVKVVRLARPAAKKGELAGRLIQYGFGAAGDRSRDLATGDLDGDGLTDVVVTDPEAAQMIVYRQRKGLGLDLGAPFAGLVGAEQVRIADFDGDKSGEVIVLSSKEKTIGLSNLRENRLTFPQPLPIEGEPIAVEVADVSGDGKPDVVYLSRVKDGRTSKYTMHALSRAADGSWKPHAFNGKSSVPLDLPGTPTRLVKVDANNDGKTEFLVFQGSDKAPSLVVFDAAGTPALVVAEGGIRLPDAADGAVFIGVVERPAVLVAKDNFVRNLEFDEKKLWKVVDQYNAAESNAKIVGAAALNLDGEPGNEIVLVDSGIKKLRVLKKEGSVFRPWREVEIGAFPFKATQIADLNGDGQDDLVLFGAGRFAVLYAGQTDPKLEDVATFETKLDDVYFADLVAGDVNGDGKTDVAVIDTRSHYIEILNYSEKHGLRHATHFKVFEEKNFSGKEDTDPEPRESLISDVTGDGRADLVLLSHDRVLIYPQDAGSAETAKK